MERFVCLKNSIPIEKSDKILKIIKPQQIILHVIYENTLEFSRKREKHYQTIEGISHQT